MDFVVPDVAPAVAFLRVNLGYEIRTTLRAGTYQDHPRALRMQPADPARSFTEHYHDRTGPRLPYKAEVLMRAAEWVERGHCKFALWDKTDSVCMVGAVTLALREVQDRPMAPRDLAMFWSSGLEEEVEHFLAGSEFRSVRQVCEFNNEPAATPRTIAAKLREMALSFMGAAHAV